MEQYLKNYHKSHKKYDWKIRGLIYREHESFEMIYNLWLNATNCARCNKTLDFSGSGPDGRCMDHDHKTGYFRNILCNSCNHKEDISTYKKRNDNKTNHACISKRVRGKCIDYKYQKSKNKVKHIKYFKTLEEAVQYKQEYESCQ